MAEVKPPLGVKPAQIHAWQRIGDLAEAIHRHYESQNGNPARVALWAEEIVIQAKVIQRFMGREETNEPGI